MMVSSVTTVCVLTCCVLATLLTFVACDDDNKNSNDDLVVRSPPTEQLPTPLSYNLTAAMADAKDTSPGKRDLLGNILTCSPSARYVLHECHQEFERDRDEFDGTYCCVYAKYVACLKEKMDIWCRRSIQQLVDATIGSPIPYDPKDPRGCQGIYYPSLRCGMFFNLRLIGAVASLVGVALGLACIICCCHCCCRRCRRKPKDQPE